MLCCLLTLLLAVPSLQSELKILNSPDGKPHPASCALTCTGISKHDEGGQSAWNGLGNGLSYKNMDITGCGFVATPVVTTTVSGYSSCPAVKVWGGHKSDRAELYVVTGEEADPDLLNSNKCDVYWTANGYTC